MPYRVCLIPILVSVAACTLPRTDRFFITQAAFAEGPPPSDSGLIARAKWDDRAIFAVQGHRISAGGEVILAVRQYSPGSWLARDDEGFEKVTVMLPDSLLREGKDLDLATSPSIAVRYSSGGSAWPSSSCFGTASGGRLRILRVREHQVEVDLSFEAALSGPAEWCGATAFRRRLVLDRRTLDGLSPWDGVASDDIYRETYPKLR